MANFNAKQHALDEYTFISENSELEEFYNKNKDVSWLGFDTEFVGEKRYHTLLCLIQVVTEHGYYLLDPLRLNHLDPFLDLLTNQNILKITHAGENDYRLLYNFYNILPRNVFDTQIAAGFIGYKYPISFSKLVENELKIYLKKGYTVSDWESRPINKRQLGYALDDVIYLHKLWHQITDKLKDFQRVEWAEEEMQKLETADFYYSDPHKEALGNNLMLNLSPKEKAFMIRLYEWRTKMAKTKNYSKEMVLPAKFIGSIVRHINGGRAALKNHRRIPKSILDNYMEQFIQMYQPPVTDEEQIVIDRIPPAIITNEGLDTKVELMGLLIKHKCNEEKMAKGLVIYGSSMKRMKSDAMFFDERLNVGWRKIFLGEAIINWLKNREHIEIQMGTEEVNIILNPKKKA